MSCEKPLVSQPNLHQIQLSGAVLESSGRADSETAIDFHIWPRFEGVIEVSLGDNWKEHCCISEIWRYVKMIKLSYFDGFHFAYPLAQVVFLQVAE